MAEYIDRTAAVKVILRERKPTNSVAQNRMLSIIQRDLLTMCAADVAPVVHGRCPICSGRKILTQDCDNGYSVEVDAEQGEMSIWQGDTCLTVISIDYCPNCGAMMDGGASE